MSYSYLFEEFRLLLQDLNELAFLLNQNFTQTLYILHFLLKNILKLDLFCVILNLFYVYCYSVYEFHLFVKHIIYTLTHCSMAFFTFFSLF